MAASQSTGGLGIRRVSSLASSAFLASAAGTRELQDRILHRVSSVNHDIFDRCLSSRADNGIQPPDVSNFHKQKKWDKAIIDAEFNHLLSQYTVSRITGLDCWQLRHPILATGSTHFPLAHAVAI